MERHGSAGVLAGRVNNKRTLMARFKYESVALARIVYYTPARTPVLPSLDYFSYPLFTVLDCSHIMYKFYKDMELEWDEAKRENNLAKHGIDFAVASELFTDYFMERLDTRQDYGEERWVALGMIRGVTVVLVYTEREGNLRPISLRKATAQERSIYEHARQKHVG